MNSQLPKQLASRTKLRQRTRKHRFPILNVHKEWLDGAKKDLRPKILKTKLHTKTQQISMHIMRVNLILIALLIHVVGNCCGYKLRRDVEKLRHHCSVICADCGGEATVDLDFCTCHIEEENADVQNCLERASNKFNYLGIKWKKDQGLVNKRSIYGSNELAYTDEFGFADDVIHRQRKKSLVRRSNTLVENIPVIGRSISRTQRTTLKQEPSSDKPTLIPLNDVVTRRAKRSLNLRDFDMDSNMFRTSRLFQPFTVYPNQQPGRFKFMISAPEDLSMQRDMYNNLKDRSRGGRGGGYDDFGSSEEQMDYNGIKISDAIDAGRFNIGRFITQQPGAYKLDPDDQILFDDDTGDLASALEEVLCEFYSPNDYYITNDYFM